MKGWKILGIVAGLILAAFGGLYLWVRSAEARRWEEMGRLIEDLVAEAGSRDSSRPVLRGEPVPGDAWEEYGPILQEWDAAMLGSVTLRRDWESGAVAALRRGVRRSSARNPYGQDWARGEGRYPMNGILALGASGLAYARQARDGAAAELTLDVAMFARDVGFNGNFGMQEGSHRLLLAALSHLHTLLQTVGPEVSRQIARELEVLDRALVRSGYLMLNELAREGRRFRTQEDGEWWGNDLPAPGWREAFSRRLMIAEGFQTLADWTRRTLEEDDVPWGSPQATRENWIWEEGVGGRNGLVRTAVQSEFVWSFEGRDLHARIHLHRLAAQYRATGEILQLPDPFGLQLRYEERDGWLRVWSVGQRRDNQGGEGDWDQMVIRVKR